MLPIFDGQALTIVLFKTTFKLRKMFGLPLTIIDVVMKFWQSPSGRNQRKDQNNHTYSDILSPPDLKKRVRHFFLFFFFSHRQLEQIDTSGAAGIKHGKGIQVSKRATDKKRERRRKKKEEKERKELQPSFSASQPAS
jgi:hypothetical protein